MKKILAAATVLLVTALAFAKGSFSANDLRPSDKITDSFVVNGFTVGAILEKEVRVMKIDVGTKTAPDGTVFTQYLDLRGGPIAQGRTISFSANAGDTVIIYGHSSSRKDARQILVRDSEKETVGTIGVNNQESAISIGEVRIPANGTYTICSAGAGVYIYAVIVK